MPKKESKSFADQLRSMQVGGAKSPENASSQTGRILEKNSNNDLPQRGLQDPPMMYRAQFQGRCNLQFAGDKGKNPDRKQWLEEWLLSTSSSTPYYQYRYVKEKDASNPSVHRVVIKFPYRVFSNSGQDSIQRPVLSQYGIPYIPGSSVKGLFKRLCHSQSLTSEEHDNIRIYCGDEENPGILRFHGAYPIGNWADQIIDVVHPQQARQVETNVSGSAFALLSFYRPHFIFEFSSHDKTIDWANVERFLRTSLRSGLGGKTSTGYGFVGVPEYADPKNSAYQSARHISLSGIGVSSVLLNGTAEFRPNMFKATLRGHLKRLLGGVCGSIDQVNQEVNRLLGSTEREGLVNLFFRESTPAQPVSQAKSVSNQPRQPEMFSIQGTLHIFATSPHDLDFMEKVLKFAYIMGGFGKSWRRVWHQTFYPHYKKFNIGCHWTSENIQAVTSKEELITFLDELYAICGDRLRNPGYLPWRESWNRERLAVYCREGRRSDAVIKLFHQDPFKTTLAIGGRSSHGAPTAVSCVWHRNLPIGKDASGQDQYLEIVTIFHHDHAPLIPFIQALQAAEMQFAWGTPCQ